MSDDVTAREPDEVVASDGATVDEAVEAAEQAVTTDLDQLARERDEYRELAQRIQADFENYKKRILKQQTEHLERATSTMPHEFEQSYRSRQS